MKKISIKRGGDVLTITAPEGKDMAINEGHLAQGILSITEFGSSGVKVAAFADWAEVIFDAESHGYELIEENRF
jgi:hypothetical protein